MKSEQSRLAMKSLNEAFAAHLHGLYVITDAGAAGGHESMARAAIAGGARVVQLRDKFIAGVEQQIGGAHLNGHRTLRVPGIVNFSFEGIEGEGLILELDARAGICCSTGSACAAGSLDPSPTLLAIGRELGLARAGTRFSLGRENTEAEIAVFLQHLPEVLAQLRMLSPETRAALVGGQSDDAG